MSIEALLSQYGLVALFVGAGLEGETAVVLGGVLAHDGYWPVWASAVAATLGSFTADQAFFYAGRHFQHHRRVERMRARPAFRRAIDAFERRPIGFIFLFRFLYGLRTVSPIAIGTTHISARTFLIANFAAAALWGVVFTGIGYVFGRAFEEVIGSLRAHLWPVLMVAAIVLATGLLWRALRWRREERT